MKSLLIPLIGWIATLYIISGYTQVELQTQYAPFSAAAFCLNDAKNQLSYARVIAVQTAYKKAQIYCIYKDSRQNSTVLLTKNALTGWSAGNVRTVGNNLRFPLYF